MNLEVSTQTERTKMEQLWDDFHKAKSNENMLTNQNSELKYSLFQSEDSLRREQLEVTRLQDKVDSLDTLVFKQKDELSRIKSDLTFEKSERCQETYALDQTMLAVRNQCYDVENKYSAEHMLRQEAEKKLEELCHTKEENKRLNLQRQSLSHEVEELKFYKSAVIEQIEDMEQKIKRKNFELQKQNEELIAAKKQVRNFLFLERELLECKDKLECNQHEKDRMVKELEQSQKQAETDLREKQEMKREIGVLISKIESYVNSINTHEETISNIELHRKSIEVELENKDRLNQKQREKIQQLKAKLETNSSVIENLEERMDDDLKLSMNTAKEIGNLRDVNYALSNKVKQNIIKTQSANTENAKISKNLLKAESEIALKSEVIKQLDNDIKELNVEINNKNFDLVKVEQDNSRSKNNLNKMKTILVETKLEEEERKASAQEDMLGAKKKISKMAQQQDQLQKTIQRNNKEIMLQVKTIHNQDDERETLQGKIEEYTEKTKSLVQNNNKLRYEYEQTRSKLLWHLSKRGKGISREHMFRSLCKTDKQSDAGLSLNKTIERLEETVKEKDAEIKELKVRLSRRPDDMIQKQFERANREFREKLKASEGCITMFKEKGKTEAEENKRLTDDLRKLKLKNARLSRNTFVHPLSTKTPAPAEDKIKVRFGRKSARRESPRFSDDWCRFHRKSGVVCLGPCSEFHCQGRSFSLPPRPVSGYV